MNELLFRTLNQSW